MAGFLSVVGGLDWESCRSVIEKRVPGGVAQAMQDAGSFFDSYLLALNAWQFGPKQAAGISQPVLSVLGTETERWFVDSHEVLHSWFPQVEDCTIEGVAHLLHMQCPEPVARAVAEFFARHPMMGTEATPTPHTTLAAVGSGLPVAAPASTAAPRAPFI
jgi:3-oxoadipate enol-lactonase